MKTWEECITFIQGRDCTIKQLEPTVKEGNQEDSEHDEYIVRITCGGTTFLLGWQWDDAGFIIKHEGDKS